MVIASDFSDRTEAADRSGEARRAGGGSPQGRRPRAPPEPQRGRRGREGRKGEPHGHHRSSAPGSAGGEPKQRGPRTAPAGGTPAGGSKRRQAAARSKETPRTRAPKQRPARAAGGRGGSGRDPCPGGGPSAPPPGTRCTRAKAARRKADRTGRPHRSKAGPKGRRAQRAAAERDSAHKRPSEGSGGRRAGRRAERGRRADRDPRRGRGPGATGDRECAKRPPQGAKAATPQRVWARVEARAHAARVGPIAAPGPGAPTSSSEAPYLARRGLVRSTGRPLAIVSTIAAPWRNRPPPGAVPLLDTRTLFRHMTM